MVQFLEISFYRVQDVSDETTLYFENLVKNANFGKKREFAGLKTKILVQKWAKPRILGKKNANFGPKIQFWVENRTSG